MNKNICLVNELKRNQVESCINVVSKYGFVKRLIIFGSSVTGNCTEESDIDLCLDIEGTTKGLHTYNLRVELNKACDHNCDILTYHKLDSKIKDEVNNKGVIVYEFCNKEKLP